MSLLAQIHMEHRALAGLALKKRASLISVELAIIFVFVAATLLSALVLGFTTLIMGRAVVIVNLISLFQICFRFLSSRSNSAGPPMRGGNSDTYIFPWWPKLSPIATRSRCALPEAMILRPGFRKK